MTYDLDKALVPQGLSSGCFIDSPASFPNRRRIGHETVLWSNFIVNAPVVYSLLERRLLYFLTLSVKHRFTEKNLGVPDSWKELYFEMTDADLGKIGGVTNVLQTYRALSDIGEKFMSISFINEHGERIDGKVHWVDTFFYNAATKKYKVRMSPEIMPYLINLSKAFTAFDIGTAMQLSSKFSQKFYELCCQFSGDFRYIDNSGKRFKKNVVPINIQDLRRLFNLEEEKDPRTGEVMTKGKYKNFNDIRKRIIEPAQAELNGLYLSGQSNVWFDYCECARVGRKITSFYFFVYTKENPKKENSHIWKSGDTPLYPFEEDRSSSIKKDSPVELWKDCTIEQLEYVVENLMLRYLGKSEVGYYLHFLSRPEHKSRDAYLQVIQVISDKERQPKFSSGTSSYKKKSIIEYALHENLKVFGWSIPPPPRSKKRNAVERSIPGLW